MKSEKHLLLGGVDDAERTLILECLRKQASKLEHAWHLTDDAPFDLSLVDLQQFAGRVVRIRALEERRPLAVVADPGAETLGAALVVHRPLDAERLVHLLNRAGGGAERREPEPAAAAAPAIAAPVSTASVARASFDGAPRQRPCTDIDSLLDRGSVLIERANLPPLVLDPARGSYHCAGSLGKIEDYFLKPVRANEVRTLSGSRLAQLRRDSPAAPIARLRWLGALLRSNGWLAAHLDPGGTYRVTSWLPMDGDYRKQWRIATTLLRPAPLHRIAGAANAPMADVFDVVNAYDAIGLLEWTPRRSRHAAPETPAAPPERRKAARTMRGLLAATVFPR